MNLPDVCIRRRESDAVVLDLRIPAEHEAFAGHFPGYPVLPGVVQVDWAIRLAAAHLGLVAMGASDIQIKFRNIILPDAPLALTLRLDRSRNWLTFAYDSPEAPKSSGLIKLKTPP